MAQGIRIPDGRDIDQIFPGRRGTRIFGDLGIRGVSGDVTNVFENMRTGQYGPATGFRASNGQDLNGWLDTRSAGVNAFTGDTTSGDVPAGEGQYGTAYITFQSDGYYRRYGTWWSGDYQPWCDNPGAGIGNGFYINVQQYSKPAACSWGGTYATWLQLNTDRTFYLTVNAPNSGSFTADLAAYFAYADLNAIRNNTCHFTAKGRYKNV